MAEKEYIERDGVMQKFADHVWLSNHSDFSTTPTWNQAVQIVEDFPAADVRHVVPGKWLPTGEGHLTSKCSACGYKSLEDGNFCPNCGADMRKANDGI